MEASWSLGVLIGVPVVGLLVVIGLAAIVLGLYARHDGGWGVAAAGFGWIVVVLGFALSPLGFYPYSAEYHQWQPVEGIVETVDKRLMRSGDGLEEKFVVRFTDTDGQQYGCQDTRCASVDEGDRLALTCKRAWQYTGMDGYDCRFISTERAA